MRPVLPLSLLLLLAAAAAVAGGPEPVPAERHTGAAKSWLGVWLRDNVDGGVQVVALVPGGPCQQAGLEVGDILLRADRIELTDQRQLRGLLDDLAPGTPVKLTVLRRGAPVDRIVRAVSPPAPLAVRRPGGSTSRAPAPGSFRVESAESAELLGVSVARITPALRRHYGAPDHAGVLVTGVDRGKLADLAGVEVGDVLIALDEREIVEARQLSSVMSSWNGQRPLQASLVRAEQVRAVVLLPARSPLAAAARKREPTARAGAPSAAISAHRAEAERLRLLIERLEREILLLKRRLADLEAGSSSAAR